MSRLLRDNSLITFLSDFGLAGGYVAACEAVMARLGSGARVLHLSHELDVGDIGWGSVVLARVAPLCPPCLHLAVVDPGVGTERRPVAVVAARGDVLVGPDNGLLAPAISALGGAAEAWLLEPLRVRREAGLPIVDMSTTFHGRDVFAPAVALLASDLPPSRLGIPLDATTLVRLPEPTCELSEEGITAAVIEVDRFGNVGLSARFSDCPFSSDAVIVEVKGEALPVWEARVVETFGQLHSGELGVYRDSWGHVALALNGASAAQLLSVTRGTTISIAPRGEA